MSFVIDAIARGVSASRAASVRPSTELWTTYARACTGGAAASAGLEATDRGECCHREDGAHHGAPG